MERNALATGADTLVRRVVRRDPKGSSKTGLVSIVDGTRCDGNACNRALEERLKAWALA